MKGRTNNVRRTMGADGRSTVSRATLVGTLATILILIGSPAAAQTRAVEGAAAESTPPTATSAELESREARLHAAIQLDPGGAAFHDSLADVLKEQGRLEEARAAIADAVRIEPSNLAYRIELAEAHAALEEWAEAESHFAWAASLAPTDADLRAALGETLRRQGRTAEAADAYAQAAALDPANEDAARQATELRQLGADSSQGALGGILGWVVRTVGFLAAALLTLAGLLLALPVLAALLLIFLVLPISMLRRKSA